VHNRKGIVSNKITQPTGKNASVKKQRRGACRRGKCAGLGEENREKGIPLRKRRGVLERSISSPEGLAVRVRCDRSKKSAKGSRWVGLFSRKRGQ